MLDLIFYGVGSLKRCSKPQQTRRARAVSSRSYDILRSTPPRRAREARSLFPGLVLGWIDADFRVQNEIFSIFQNLQENIRKSSSREQIWQISAKKLQILENLPKLT